MSELIEVPHSEQAEQSVLGSILIDNTVFDDLRFLTAEDFYSSSNRAIFAKIEDHLNNGKAVDPIILHENWPELVNNGGLSYLGSLVKNTPTTANVKAYAKIVREKSRSRHLAKVSNKIFSLMAEKDVDDAIDQAQGLLMNLGETNAKQKTMKEVLENCINNLEDRFNNKGKLVGLSTGFSDIDRRLNGLNKSNLIIVAARPGCGKTTFMMNIAEHVGVTQHLPVAVFSMEMANEELMDKSVCSISNIDYGDYRANVDDEIIARSIEGFGKLLSSKIMVDDTPALNVNQIRSRCRKIKRIHGLSLVCIDYLQLMSGKGENRVQIVSEISRGLKSLAKELEVPVIALSQLNRDLERRPNKRPQLADLRDSGAIEQDADVILFLYRDVLYDEDSKWKGITEVETAKQRSGTTGRNYLSDQLQYSRFKDFCGNLPAEDQANNINSFYKKGKR